MTTAQLKGQTVVVIGGSAGIGLETARRARAEEADVMLTARNPERLQQAALRAIRRGRSRCSSRKSRARAKSMSASGS